jgi:membrane protease YdiL (CAAX protease family)
VLVLSPSAFDRVSRRAVIAVTLIFSLVHVPQYYESPQTIVLLTLLSLILTLMRVFSAIYSHASSFIRWSNGAQSGRP